METSLENPSLIREPDKMSLPDMSLADEDAGVVDALGQAEFEDLCLQPALQEVLHLQTQDVIELHLPFIQHPDAH